MKLYKNVVPKEVFRLLLSFNQTLDPATQNFSLAGGTNIALRFGHRVSVDLDFFTKEAFDVHTIEKHVAERHPDYIKTDQSAEHIRFMIKGVKVEYIRHDYPYLMNSETIENIKLYSLADVTAMKLNAIINRGAKKDFFDIAEILQRLSLAEIIRFFLAKYPNTDEALAVRSLSYFDDAENEPEPMQTKHTWPQVKNKITQTVARYLNLN